MTTYDTVEYITPEIDEPISGWEPFTLADAYQERPPTRYIVDKVIAEQSLNIVYAPPAALKSMILADLACCVAAGKDWLVGNGLGVQTEQTGVLWVDLDNGAKRTHERFKALGQGHNLTVDTPLTYISMPTEPNLHLTSADAVFHLGATIREYGAGLVIIDNLGLITGDVEENSAGMAQIMGYLRVVTERTGAAIIVIHHQRKGGASGGRAGDALRGHSSIEAALDVALHVVREPGERLITITSTKTRGVDIPILYAMFNYEHRPGTNDLGIAWFSNGQIQSKFATLNERATLVLDAAKFALNEQNNLVQEKLIQRINEITDIGVNSIRPELKQLVIDGYLVVKTKGRARIFQVSR